MLSRRDENLGAVVKGALVVAAALIEFAKDGGGEAQMREKQGAASR